MVYAAVYIAKFVRIVVDIDVCAPLLKRRTMKSRFELSHVALVRDAAT